MQRVFLLFSIFVVAGLSAQEIPYKNTPDWESTAAGRISTGLGLADINGDGWKDMIVADGNDIQRQHLTLHYNNGDGTYPLSPDWESDDIDYHGHLAVGDLNDDGWPDVAVSVYIGPSGFSDPGKLKIYFNQQGELESTPSFESMPFYTFSCAMGDADGDGDLDIGVACGEPYSSILDKGRIYYNDNGTFSDDHVWESYVNMGSLDVEFGDIDLNGYLDIVFTCEDTHNYIYFADELGQISDTAGWESSDPENYINSVDIGYHLEGDPYTFLVMTGNDQLGGDGRLKMYNFDSDPFETTPSWESNPFGYGSGIILYSVLWEDEPDLIYGGWWKPVKIALNTENGYELNASYTSSETSVVEAILISDLGQESWIDTTYINNDTIQGNLILLPHPVVEKVSSVSVEDVVLADEMWKHIPGKGWVVVSDEIPLYPPVAVKYKHSPHGDMVITNWDSGKGNFIYYNTNEPVGIPENNVQDELEVYPNPADDFIYIDFGRIHHSCNISILDQHGRQILHTDISNTANARIACPQFPAGMYILKCAIDGNIKAKKFFIIHK